VHSGDHFAPFYTEESRLYQKSFLDRWLKDDTTAWQDQPPVKLKIRTADGGQFRAESEWPIARTQWTKLYLDAVSGALGNEPPPTGALTTYTAPTGSATFLTAPFADDVEITGPIAVHAWVQTGAADMDLFVTIIDLDSSGQEVLLQESAGFYGAVVKGWLRASHRRLDQARSHPYRPYHTHAAADPVPVGEPFEIQIEVLPTSMVFQRGHRLGLVIGASDRREDSFVGHTDPNDRSGRTFGRCCRARISSAARRGAAASAARTSAAATDRRRRGGEARTAPASPATDAAPTSTRHPPLKVQILSPRPMEHRVSL
jgi:predicted acyl esterase